MKRTYEEILADAKKLDRESQEHLIEEIKGKLASNKSPIKEAKRRAEAVDRGHMETADGPEALTRVRNKINAAQ